MAQIEPRDKPGTAIFVGVTEIEGQHVSKEQLYRTCHRYHWAATHCEGRDALEVACGSGLGLGLLSERARSLSAGDISPELIKCVRATYGDSVVATPFSAELLPFADKSFDVVLLFEALYYIPRPDIFFTEAHRVLRASGRLLIVTANKDLFDFTASPFSQRYLGVVELTVELRAAGFRPTFGGLIDTRTVAVRQRILRPVKLLASRLNMVPKTMRGKAWLKKLFFGEMTLMPRDIRTISVEYDPPAALPAGKADTVHKVIYCEAIKE